MRARCGVCTGEVVVPARGRARGRDRRSRRRGRAARAVGRRAARSGWTSRPGAWCATARTHPSLPTAASGCSASTPMLRRSGDGSTGRWSAASRRWRGCATTFARVAGTRTPESLAIVGEPGIGKSHLAAELTAIAGDGGRLLTGRCPAHRVGTTYWPLREIVLQAMGDRSIDALVASLGVAPSVARQVAAATGLEEGRAGRGRRLGLPAADRCARASAAADPRHRRRAPGRACAPGPARSTSPRGCATRPRCWSGSHARSCLERRPEWARRVGADRVLELRPALRRGERSAARGDRGRRLDAEVERRIAEAAAAIPLFLEQLVAYVDEQHPAAGPLPPALQALLTARLDRLDAAERSALALGAVAATCSRPQRCTRWPTASPGPSWSRPATGSCGASCSLPGRGRASASGTTSSARPPTRRWRRLRVRACTSGMPSGSTGWAAISPRPTRGSASISRRRAGTRARSGRALRPSSRPGPAGGSRPPPASRAAAATCWARSASSTAPSRCSGPTGRRARRCCRRSCRRCPTPGSLTGRRSSRIRPCRPLPRSASRGPARGRPSSGSGSGSTATPRASTWRRR